MDLKDYLRNDPNWMLSHAINSEGGGGEALNLPIAAVAGHMFHGNISNYWNSAYGMHEHSERSVTLQHLLPASTIPMSDIFGQFGDIEYHNQDSFAIAHEIEADNNRVNKLKNEASMFAEDQTPRPGLLAERASDKFDVNAPMVAVNVEERSSAMIQVDTQIVVYKVTNSQEISFSKKVESLKKKTKSTKSYDSTSAGVAPVFGFMQEGTAKRALKRPAKFQETTTNPSLKNSFQVNTNESEKIFPTANVTETNLSALKAREHRKKKKLATIALQSENKSMKEVNEALKLDKIRLISELENEKKLTTAILDGQRVFPTVVQPIQTVLMSLMGENCPAGAGGPEEPNVSANFAPL